MYTPGFAAPELYVRGTSLGPWSDVYSLGACLYSCMRGYPPMDVPTRRKADNLTAHLERLRGVYSDALLAVVGRCLSLDPALRPQSVLELQKSLPNGLAGHNQP
jgi:serine/threonine protein kinase